MRLFQIERSRRHGGILRALNELDEPKPQIIGEIMINVVLTYYKQSGKYYSTGYYHSLCEHFFQLGDEVKEKQKSGTLPGLVSGGGKEFYIHVDAPGHENNVPRLIHPLKRE